MDGWIDSFWDRLVICHPQILIYNFLSFFFSREVWDASPLEEFRRSQNIDSLVFEKIMLYRNPLTKLLLFHKYLLWQTVSGITLGADIRWGRSHVYNPYYLWPYYLWRTAHGHIDIESGFLLRILRENRVRRRKGKTRMFCFVFLALECSPLSKTRFSCASHVSRNMFR